MMNFPAKLYKTALQFVTYFTFILMCLLFLGGFLRTAYAADMNTQQVLIKWDNPFISLAVLFIFLLFSGVAVRLAGSRMERLNILKQILLYAVLAWILALGCFFILFGKTTPSADAMSVYGAAELLASGDTSVIHPTESYFSYYPQQVGLMAFLEVLFRIWNLFGLHLPAYHFLKGIYVLLLCMAVFFQYKYVHLLCQNDLADCFYLLLTGANIPLIMYSSFLYGEIPSFAAFSAGMYFLLLFLRLLREHSEKTFRIRSTFCLSLLFFTLSTMLRKNTLILIIAVCLVVLLEWVRTRRHILLVFTITCALLASVILPATQKFYEYRAQNTLSSGVTAMSYFAMGMQESSRANGWYNGFNFNTYQESGMNSETANEISRQAIRERMEYFKSNPEYALSFYTDKHLSQWADGSYASRQATISNAGGRHPLLQSLYEGDFSRCYIDYCNHYQNILYLGALLFCIAQCFPNFSRLTVKAADHGTAQAISSEHQKKNLPMTGLPIFIGFIGVIGGFLFHILWEANSRYIFVYSLLLIPYAAQGLSLLTLLPIRKRISQPYSNL